MDDKQLDEILTELEEADPADAPDLADSAAELLSDALEAPAPPDEAVS